MMKLETSSNNYFRRGAEVDPKAAANAEIILEGNASARGAQAGAECAFLRVPPLNWNGGQASIGAESD